MSFSRAKRVTDPLADEVKALLVGSSSSSGSDHTGDDSPCLSDLVQSFLEDEFETIDDEFDQDSCSDSDSDSDQFELPDFADEITKILRNSLKDDSYGRTVLIHVVRAMEVLSSLTSHHEQRAVSLRKDKVIEVSSFESEHEQRAVLLRKVMSLLRDLGHNAAICKTKWNSSSGGRIPAGKHEFIDVISSQSHRYIIDLDFASRFQIARPSLQYTRVLKSLPVVFVGRVDDLKRILRFVCDAARISLRNCGLIIPPWRKYRYMQIRWLGAYKRSVNLTASSSSAVSTVMCRAVGFDNSVGGRLFVRTR